MNKDEADFFTRTKKRKMKSISCILALLMVFTSIPVFASASADVNTSVKQPLVSGAFDVSTESSTSYAAPTNTFSDGSPKYYLITNVSANSTLTSISYQGKSYPLKGVYYGSDINAASSFFTDNSTVFFDDGTYNDSNSDAYDRFSKVNLSLVGLNRDSNGEPMTTITKNARIDDPNTGTINRYNISKDHIYFENLIFDGQNKNMTIKKYWGDCCFADKLQKICALFAKNLINKTTFKETLKSL
jgi:hypothetical protein